MKGGCEMNELQTTIQGMTVNEICANPDSYPEEVVAAAFDALNVIKKQIRENEVNLSANMIRRMREDNATKIPFINVKGEQKYLTLKKGAMKVNPTIKDIEAFIIKTGLAPKMLGEHKFVPHSWGKCKELRKMGGDLQVVIDEIYIEGSPSLTVTE
jgi:hypothetical protein